MVSSFVRGSLFALLAGGALALAACGGGGGSSAPPSVPTPTPTSVSGTCPSPPPAGNGTAYTVGATRTWCVAVATIGTSNITYQAVATTLEAQSSTLNVWVDDADLGQLTTADWQQVANDFVPIYSDDTTYFGGRTFPQLGVQTPNTFKECSGFGGATISPSTYPQPNFSADNNGYGPQIDMVATNKLGGGEGGYFTAIDLVAYSSALCASAYSNEAEVFFAATPTTSAGTEPTSFYLNGDVLRTEAHEFQHMLHAINKTYTGFAQNGGVEVFDPSWIDEGFSMLAEDLAYPSSPGPSGDPIRYAFQFVNAPSDYSLTEFEGLACAPTATSCTTPTGIYNYTGGNYGAAYLFWRWLVDTKGAGILKTIIGNQDTSPSGSGANEILSATGYASFPQMFDDWEMAVAASQRYAPSGVFAYTASPQGNGSAFDDSYGTYTIPSPCSVPNPSPGVTCNLVNHKATFTFPGPQPPATLSGGSLPSTNGAQTLSFYATTANYIPISGTGLTPDDSMSATDTTGGSGIVGGYVAKTASASVAECAPVSNKVGCTVTGSPDPTSVVFAVGLGNAPADAGNNAPTLSSFSVNLAANQTNTPPAPSIGTASIVRLPQSAGRPIFQADGFVRPERPAAVGYRALHRLFMRGVVRGIQPLSTRRR